MKMLEIRSFVVFCFSCFIFFLKSHVVTRRKHMILLSQFQPRLKLPSRPPKQHSCPLLLSKHPPCKSRCASPTPQSPPGRKFQGKPPWSPVAPVSLRDFSCPLDPTSALTHLLLPTDVADDGAGGRAGGGPQDSDYPLGEDLTHCGRGAHKQEFCEWGLNMA